MIQRKYWSGSVLTILWTLEFLLLPLVIFSFAAVVMEYEGDVGYAPAWAIVLLCFFVSCFMTLPYEITGYLYHFLNPWVFLALQIYKTAVWAPLAAAAIYFVVARLPAGINGIFALVARILVSVEMIASFVTLFIALMYSVGVVHRYRKSGGHYDYVEEEKEKKKPASQNFMD